MTTMDEIRVEKKEQSTNKIDLATQSLCWDVVNKHVNQSMKDGKYSWHIVHAQLDITPLIGMTFEQAVKYVNELDVTT